MQYTSNYNLITVEGTDIVNPLVQMNPNFTDIDAAMFANKQATIGSASEIVSGTVHAITRANPDSNYFKFTATGNWTLGDSMSIDGVNVSTYLTDGTIPGTGSYVINSEVFGILAGTRVTLFLTNPTTTLPAGNITFNPSGTTLDPSDTDVDAAIRDLSGRVSNLWANPNPTVDFTPQTVTLSSNDYDFLLMIGISATDNNTSMSEIVPRGRSTILSQSSHIATGILNISRDITYVSDTSYFIDAAYRAVSQDGNTPTISNNRCIPAAIYGIKI